jgi:pimeloyl-ACP methyl ester carboxylesterase
MRHWRRNLTLLGGLVFGLLVAPFLVPVRRPRGTVSPELLADPDSRFITLRGLRLHYKIAGQGRPAVLLLHGLGASLFSWHRVMDPMAQTATVIAFDRPGFGLTSRPMPGEWTGASPYGPEFQADLVAELLDALGLDRVVLVGHSAGGRIAALAALRHPERVEALVLVDPAIYLDGAMWLLRPLLSTPQMRRLGPLAARYIMDSRGEEAIRLSWHDQSKVTPEILAGYKKPTEADNWDRALWEVTAANHPVRLVRELSSLSMPSLVITGEHDRLVPSLLSMRVAKELPDARLVAIPDCGHVPQEECPEQFLKAATEFLTELRSRPCSDPTRRGGPSPQP